MSHERCVAILRRLLLRRIFETQRPGKSHAVGVGLGRLICRLFRGKSHARVYLAQASASKRYEPSRCEHDLFLRDTVSWDREARGCSEFRWRTPKTTRHRSRRTRGNWHEPKRSAKLPVADGSRRVGASGPSSSNRSASCFRSMASKSGLAMSPEYSEGRDGGLLFSDTVIRRSTYWPG